MLQYSWSTHLSDKPRLISYGMLPEPSLVYQSQSNQLMIQNNMTQNLSLPFKKQLIQLGILPLKNHILLLSCYQLSCQDLLNNNQIFCKQFDNAIKMQYTKKYIYVVSGFSIFCYTHYGQQIYINHLTNLIQVLTTISYSQIQQVVMVFQNTNNMVKYNKVNLVYDYGKMPGIPTSICSVEQGIIIGTQQGTIAYFQQEKKPIWKMKSKSSCLKVMVNPEQQKLVLVARKNGSVELRNLSNANILCKIKMGEPILQILFADFYNRQNLQLLCIMKSGNIKGYNFVQKISNDNLNPKNKLVDEIVDSHEQLDELMSQKINLQYQVSNLRKVIAQNKKYQGKNQSESILNSNFQIFAQLQNNNKCQLSLKCREGYISGICFEQPIKPISIEKKNEVIYTFNNQNSIFGEIHCQVLVHSSYSSQIYQIKRMKVQLPKFWKWSLRDSIKSKIKNQLKFEINERFARYLKWIQQCFLVKFTANDLNKYENQSYMRFSFVNQYQKIQLTIVFKRNNIIRIYCDCLQTMGEIVQDLVEYTKIKELQSELLFPQQKQKLLETLKIIQKLSQTKISISSQMTDAINNIKFMLVLGESARCVGSLGQMRKCYGQVMIQNRNILAEMEKKNRNTIQLSQAMKELGKLINQTSNVRFGSCKEKIIRQARNFIKKRDFFSIIALMETGNIS